MAVPPIVIKAVVTAATDKRTWKFAAVLITAIFMPVIIIVLMFAMLFSGLAGENKNMLDYSFKNARIPGSFNSEQRGAIKNMRGWLGELDDIIPEKENDEERSLDENMVRAAFYCLNFGAELDEDFDYDAFCGCFDGLSFEQLETALQNVSDKFPQYEITGNITYSIGKIYEYLTE